MQVGNEVDDALRFSVIRLRYAHQIPGSRDEIKALSSKLRHLTFQWEGPSKMVTTILTFIRSSTRSGREYGFTPPADHNTCTAQNPESFTERVEDIFADYCIPF